MAKEPVCLQGVASREATTRTHANGTRFRLACRKGPIESSVVLHQASIFLKRKTVPRRL